MAASAPRSSGETRRSHRIEHVFFVCSFLPLIGLLTAFLPNLDRKTAALIELAVGQKRGARRRPRDDPGKTAGD